MSSVEGAPLKVTLLVLAGITCTLTPKALPRRDELGDHQKNHLSGPAGSSAELGWVAARSAGRLCALGARPVFTDLCRKCPATVSWSASEWRAIATGDVGGELAWAGSSATAR